MGRVLSVFESFPLFTENSQTLDFTVTSLKILLFSCFGNKPSLKIFRGLTFVMWCLKSFIINKNDVNYRDHTINWNSILYLTVLDSFKYSYCSPFTHTSLEYFSSKIKTSLLLLFLTKLWSVRSNGMPLFLYVLFIRSDSDLNLH